MRIQPAAERCAVARGLPRCRQKLRDLGTTVRQLLRGERAKWPGRPRAPACQHHLPDRARRRSAPRYPPASAPPPLRSTVALHRRARASADAVFQRNTHGRRPNRRVAARTDRGAGYQVSGRELHDGRHGDDVRNRRLAMARKASGSKRQRHGRAARCQAGQRGQHGNPLHGTSAGRPATPCPAATRCPARSGNVSHDGGA